MTTAQEELDILKSLGFDMAPQEVSNEWKKQKFILAGHPKVGKTTLLAQNGEKTYTIRLAQEFNSVKTWGCDCKDYKDFDNALIRLTQAASKGIFPWDTISIDPAPKLMDYLAQQTIEDGKEKFPNSDIHDVGDIGKGTGWGMLKNLTKATLDRIDKLPCAKFLVFHILTEEKSDNPKDKTKSYKCDVISASEKMGLPFRAWADHIIQIKAGYVGDNMQARSLITRGSKILEAGTKSKKLPEVIPLSTDDAKNWTTLRSFFDM